MLNRGLIRAAYGAFAGLLFVAFVTASFPYAEIFSALLAPMKMKVVFQRQTISFPIGARLEDVRLISAADQQLLLESPEITVLPCAWFVLGQPSLRLRAHVWGGRIDATVRQRSRNILVGFRLNSLNLAQMSAPPDGRLRDAKGDQLSVAPDQLGVLLGGALSGEGSAQLIGPNIIAGKGSITIRARGVTATLVNGLPALELGVLQGRVLFEQGVASLQDLEANGSDGVLTANGEIRIATNLAQSLVELTLWLRPIARAQASFGPLLNLLPHPPNEGPYHLSGPLTSPSLS
jgi:type II secretion system protein N